MNKERQAYCEHRYQSGDYAPLPEWVEYERLWADYEAQCDEVDAQNRSMQDMTVMNYGSGGGWDDSRDRIPWPAAPTTQKPTPRVLQKFEYMWLKRYHPELLDYHAYELNRIVLGIERALLFAWHALFVLLFVLVVCLALIGAIIILIRAVTYVLV